MDNEIYAAVRAELQTRPARLHDLAQWLFVVVNTAKAIIHNSGKQDPEDFQKLSTCSSVSELQYAFDVVQGRFGREGFSFRRSPAYLYLCSLVAHFPDQELTERDRELIRAYSTAQNYLLYDL